MSGLARVSPARQAVELPLSKWDNLQSGQTRLEKMINFLINIYNQEIFTCVWWFDFDCSSAESFYSLNADLYSEAPVSSNPGGGGGSSDNRGAPVTGGGQRRPSGGRGTDPDG